MTKKITPPPPPSLIFHQEARLPSTKKPLKCFFKAWLIGFSISVYSTQLWAAGAADFVSTRETTTQNETISIPTTGSGYDHALDRGAQNFNQSYSKEEWLVMRQGLWTNTEGQIRDIQSEEINTPINSVGTIECTVGGEVTSSTGTLVPRIKGKGPIILFSGHNTCYEGVSIPKENCVFLHTYVGDDSDRYGKVYEHSFKQVNTNYKCGQSNFDNDIAVATLESFGGYWTPSLTYTYSINKRRYLDEDGKIKFPSKRNPAEDYGDLSMLLVGYDPYHEKLMISENCGLFDKSEPASISSFTSSQLTHDCLTTQGYSGGPVFQKQWNKKKSNYEYNLVCVNGGNRSYGADNPNYRLLNTGFSGGRCETIEKETIIELYKSVGAAE